MTVLDIGRRGFRAAVAVCAAMLLSSCLLSAGKFTSALDLRKDGTFTFSYQGEIFMLPLSELASRSGSGAGEEEFVAIACYDDETYEDRECTEEELDQQRKDWAESIEASKRRQAEEAESYKAMLGGIDPSDPKAAEELAERLRRQVGWKKVEYRGDGLFVVDFSITSKMDRDFVFPTMERFPMANDFVSATVRSGNAVRIEAPGFSPGSSASPSSNLMQMASLGGSESGSNDMPPAPTLDGTFTITTDGRILANNTDEGPQATVAGQSLSWTINPRTAAAPMALIELGN